MKQKLTLKGLLILIAPAVAILCLVLPSVGNANTGLPASTPAPFTKTWLHVDTGRLEDSRSLRPSQTRLSSISLTSITLNSVTDAEVVQGYPTAGCGNELMMRVGYDDYLNPDGRIVRGLVKFNLSAIPAGATINSAELQLYLVESWDYAGHSRTVTTYRITSPWAEDIVSWNDVPTLAEAYGSAPVTHGDWKWYSFGVTDLIRGWHNGTYPNYGIALRGPEHSGSDSSWKAFATGETTYAPRLIVNFTPSATSASRTCLTLDASAPTGSRARAMLAGDFDLVIEPLSRLIAPGESISYTVFVSSTGGFTNGVSLTIGSLPDQTTHAWSANSITPTLGSPVVSSTLYVSTTASTPLGIYTPVVTGTGGGITHTAHFTLNVTVPDFGIVALPSGRVVTQGDVATYTLSLTVTELFSGAVNLDVASVPAGAVGVFTPNPVTPPATATMTVPTDEVMPAQYTLVVTGTGGSITHTTSVTLTVQQRFFYVYLPVILKRYPPLPDAPVLYPIDNDNGEGEYTIDWEPAYLADLYTLQEYVSGDWQGLYTGTNTSFDVSGKATGTYRYRVLATNDWGSAASQERSVTVSDVDHTTIFLFIGVADYLYMDPPYTSVRAGAPGYDVIYPVCDTTDKGDTYSVCGCSGVVASQFFGAQTVNGCPLANMLVLNDSQATKAAIQDGITNWLDARETPSTTVVIFFSGHGSYGPDVYPLDEADGYDEYLAPHDLACDPCGPTPETTTWDLTTAIRDDELEDWLDELASQRIILFVDSCFSGGMIEATGGMVRGFSTVSDGDVGVLQAGDGLLADVSEPGRIVLTASAADQPSWEFGALKNGAFTYYLVKALQSHAADTNYNGWVSAEETFAYLTGRVDNYVYSQTGYHQNPQLYDGVGGEVDLTQPVAVTTCP